MKRIVIALLVLNLVLFAWQYNSHVETITRNALTAEPLPPDTPGIVLLAELEHLPQQKAPRADAPVATTQYSEVHEHVDASDRCLNIGPFADATRRDQFRDWLRDYIAVLNMRVEETEQRRFFWVYLEPSDPDQAAQDLANLTRRGITDTLLIRRGEMQNAISLGLFRSQDSVNRRLAELSEKGYKPVVVPQFQSDERYWFSARLAADYADGLDLPESLLGDATAEPMACSTI